MKQCPQCNFENIKNRFYCESCGTILPSSTQVKTPTVRSQEHISSPFHLLAPPPSLPTLHRFIPLEGDVEPVLSQPRSHMFLHTSASLLLYVVGSLIAAFGLFTVLAPFTDGAFVGFLSLFVSSIVLLLLAAFVLHRVPLLNWRQRLLAEFVVTGGAFVLLLIGAVIVGIQPEASTFKVSNLIYGGIILLYGTAVAVVALW